MDCRKDLHGIFLYFNKQSFSVLGQKKIATQQAVKSEFEKRSFFIQTINDATCSNSIIHYLNKETRRVKRESYSIDRMISLHLRWLWNSNSHWRWRENLLSLYRRLNVLKTSQLNGLLWWLLKLWSNEEMSWVYIVSTCGWIRRGHLFIFMDGNDFFSSCSSTSK